jgi:phosphodiesterase/alkaline phosphatase D-like protein
MWRKLTIMQGYIANRNRTIKHLYDNEIDNGIFLAGDSHRNWVCTFAADKWIRISHIL